MNLCRHILLVDEDGFRRRDQAFLLQIGGFAVQTVNTPIEAINWLAISRAASHPCDLILMIGCFGLHDDRQVFEAVKEVGACIPVVIVDRDSGSGRQIVWCKPVGEEPCDSFHQRPRVIADIVRSFFRDGMGEYENEEMAES